MEQVRGRFSGSLIKDNIVDNFGDWHGGKGYYDYVDRLDC